MNCHVNESVRISVDRRRMSVVVRSADGLVWLVCKGADTAVFPQCVHSEHTYTTQAHLHHFAQVRNINYAIVFFCVCVCVFQ